MLESDFEFAVRHEAAQWLATRHHGSDGVRKSSPALNIEMRKKVQAMLKDWVVNIELSDPCGDCSLCRFLRTRN